MHQTHTAISGRVFFYRTLQAQGVASTPLGRGCIAFLSQGFSHLFASLFLHSHRVSSPTQRLLGRTHAGKGLEGKGKAPGAKGPAAQPRGSERGPSSCPCRLPTCLGGFPTYKRGQRAPVHHRLKTLWPDLRHAQLRSVWGMGRNPR